MRNELKEQFPSVRGSELSIRVDSGLSLGKVYCLKNVRSTLGRAVDAEIPIDDSRVSRNHASILEQRGEFFLSDMGSTNGTFLNEVFLKETTKLHAGDKIRVGSTVFIVQSVETAKSEAAPVWREATRAIRPMNEVSTKHLKGKEQASISKRDSIGVSGIWNIFMFVGWIFSFSLALIRKIFFFIQKILRKNLRDLFSKNRVQSLDISQAPSGREKSSVSPHKSHDLKAKLVIIAGSICVVLAAILSSL